MISMVTMYENVAGVYKNKYGNCLLKCALTGGPAISSFE